MKKVFIDFETDGLEGKIIEIAATDKKENIFFQKNPENLNNFYDDLKKYYKNDFIIIFWHKWMIEYLIKHELNFYNNLSGKSLIFTDIYSFMDKNRHGRYKIDYITSNLINRKHKGNAKDDAIDLKDCYYKLSKINKKRKSLLYERL